MSAPFICTSVEITAFEKPRNFTVLLTRLVSQSVIILQAHWQESVHIQSKCGNGVNVSCTCLIKRHICKCKGGLISSPGAWFIFLWLHSVCTSANHNEHLEFGVWSLDVWMLFNKQRLCVYIYRDNCNSVLLVSVENQRQTHPHKNHLYSGGRFTKYAISNDREVKKKIHTYIQDVSSPACLKT